MNPSQLKILTIDDVLNYRSCGAEEKKRVDALIRAAVPEGASSIASNLLAILPESICSRINVRASGAIVLDDYQLAILNETPGARTVPDTYKTMNTHAMILNHDAVTAACIWVVSVLSKRLALGGIYMDVAKRYASLSTCNRRHVGAILVKDGRIISTGTNGSPEGAPHCIDEGCFLDEKNHCQRTVHAEQNAILFCAREGITMKGAAIYCTDFPCTKCLQSILQTGIRSIYFERDYTDIYNKVLANSVRGNVDFYNYDKGYFKKVDDFTK